jgi:hypothetical protein
MSQQRNVDKMGPQAPAFRPVTYEESTWQAAAKCLVCCVQHELPPSRRSFFNYFLHARWRVRNLAMETEKKEEDRKQKKE